MDGFIVFVAVLLIASVVSLVWAIFCLFGDLRELE
jgi:hypothetical protein